MEYFIGIDGGGTTTVGRIRLGQNILGEYTVGATNYHTAPLASVKERLKDLIENLCAKAGVHLNQINGICFGGAGIDTEADLNFVGQLFRSIGYENKLIVVNDSVIALVGANSGYRGAILISGTGSIALAITPSKNQVRVGGWGHLIGDEGSGYSIARDAFTAIAKTFDRRGPEPKPFSKFKEIHAFKTGDDLIAYVYLENRGKEEIAKFAQGVIELYEVDQVAKAIIDKAVEEMVETIKAINLHMENEPFELSVAGSVLTKSPLVYKGLETAWKTELAHIELHMPVDDPISGALILAEAEKGNIN